ncbi:MAG: aldose epimerase [Rhodanobacter sp.]
MTGYRAERALLGPHEIVVLSDEVHGRSMRIARRGATVLSITQVVEGVTHTLSDGYCDAGELDSRPSSRFAIMAPFANRIDDARYEFDGVSYDMQPGIEASQRASRHGLVRGVDFEIASLHADEHGTHVTMTTQAIRPQPGYPHAIDLAVNYTLAADGLTLEVVMRNVGDTAAPCFFGWHPYFRVGDTAVDSWELTIPADTLIRIDTDYIPLTGADAYVALSNEPGLDFRQSHAIGAIKLDHCYTNLARDADGRIRTHLRDPSTGIALAVWQEHGVMLAFSADTITRDVRRSVALEPMESMSNAFNRPDCADAIRLEPGAERRFLCGVEIALA